MIKDPTIFSDIADALKIGEPSFVEKDYYAIQLLKLINELEIPDFRTIFSGGTCLSKAYQNTQRMSEDIDIKFTARKPDRKKSHRKALGKLILDEIQKSPIFSLSGEPTYRDVYRTQDFEIQYPKQFNHPALKAVLKLELVESAIYEPIHQFSVGSIYTDVMKEPVEINAIECVNMESIVVEKLIALLWRTSAHALSGNRENEQALVRHVYDIHILLHAKKADINLELLREISIKSLEDHAARYKNKHPAFSHDPKKALSHGLDEIQSNAVYQDRYEKLLSPLVYAQNPPKWNEALNSLVALYQDLYHD